MSITVFGNKKGGVTKSITCFNTAVAAVNRAIRQGRDYSNEVIIVDADKNQTCMNQSQYREATSKKWVEMGYPELPFLKVDLKRPEDSLTKTLQELNKVYKIVLVDTGGFENNAFKTSVGIADQIYLPFQPSQSDIEQLIPTLDVIEDIESTYRSVMDPEFRTDPRLLITLVDHNSKDMYSEAMELTKDLVDIASISGVSIPRIKKINKNTSYGIGLSDPQISPSGKPTKPCPKRGCFELLLDEIDGTRKPFLLRDCFKQ